VHTKFNHGKGKIISEMKNLNPPYENSQVEHPLLIKIEGKSIEMQKKKLIDRSDSITVCVGDNYDSNDKLFAKEKLKENNFMKGNKITEDKNKLLLNNKINAINKIGETISNDFIY